jgi:hypothetical protein
VSQDNTPDIFSKLSADERLRLFKDLANVRGEIVCKGERDDVFRLTVERATGKQELQCSVPFGFSLPNSESDILGNFFIGGERYFFKTPVRVEGNIVILRMDTEIFHLQRRQNYRIRIPEKYQATLLISSHNKAAIKLSAQLIDLSSGGCRVALAASLPILETGDRIDGHIVIGKKDSIEIEGTVRHHKLEKSVPTTKQIFGVEFKALSTTIEGKIFAITMELHREFFSKLYAKS